MLMKRFQTNVCKNRNILVLVMFSAVLIHGCTDVTIFWIQTGMLFLLVYTSTGIHNNVKSVLIEKIICLFIIRKLGLHKNMKHIRKKVEYQNLIFIIKKYIDSKVLWEGSLSIVLFLLGIAFCN